MRAIWSGAIGFGLVNIPIKLFSATNEGRLDLDMLDKKDHAHIKYQRINENTGKEVKWENIVKGYLYDDEYVVLTDEDFEEASPKKSKLIEIEEFVHETEIDVTFFDTPYYLQPEKYGERPYALLREALKKSGKLAIGTYVMRNREHLCALKPHNDAILLLKLRFPEEIRDEADLTLPSSSTSVKPAEMKMAMALIDQLTPDKFSIDKYKDTYVEDLMSLVEQKVKGKKPKSGEFKVVRSKSKDLMSQLKASLEGGSGKNKKAS